MTIEQRLENLERLVNALSKKIDNQKFYADADMSGVRKGVADATPFTYSKMVGIQDTECVFTDVVAEGTLTANVKTEKGEYLPCSVERADSRVRVSFDTLDSVATVTIQIQ